MNLIYFWLNFNQLDQWYLIVYKTAFWNLFRSSTPKLFARKVIKFYASSAIGIPFWILSLYIFFSLSPGIMTLSTPSAGGDDLTKLE